MAYALLLENVWITNKSHGVSANSVVTCEKTLEFGGEVNNNNLGKLLNDREHAFALCRFLLRFVTESQEKTGANNK